MEVNGCWENPSSTKLVVGGHVLEHEILCVKTKEKLWDSPPMFRISCVEASLGHDLDDPRARSIEAAAVWAPPR